METGRRPSALTVVLPLVPPLTVIGVPQRDEAAAPVAAGGALADCLGALARGTAAPVERD